MGVLAWLAEKTIQELMILTGLVLVLLAAVVAAFWGIIQAAAFFVKKSRLEKLPFGIEFDTDTPPRKRRTGK